MVLRSGCIDWEGHSNDPTSDIIVIISFCFLSGGDGKEGMESTL